MSRLVGEESLGESWVDMTTHGMGTANSGRQTPLPFTLTDEHLRLLREAQRDSNQSSARVSLASTRKNSPHESPKSPPNSPNTEANTDYDFRDVYINGSYSDYENINSTDWIWDWSSRPDVAPPKEWKLKHPKGKPYSIRHVKVGKNSLFSKEVIYTLVLTNVLSLLLGTGFGLWLSRRSAWARFVLE